MKRSILIILTAVLFFSCTKDIPETEKKIARTINESDVRLTINNFYNSYNAGNIESALENLAADYKGIVPDSDEAVSKDNYSKELTLLKKQYPEGKWEIKIEEILLGEEYAIVTTLGSFMMPNPIEKKMTPSYSERNLIVLRKVRNDGWKIIRTSSVPAFTYEEN